MRVCYTYLVVILVNCDITRKLSYRKDDSAMLPVYGCPEKFSESLGTPTAIFPEILIGFCSDRSCE